MKCRNKVRNDNFIFKLEKDEFIIIDGIEFKIQYSISKFCCWRGRLVYCYHHLERIKNDGIFIAKPRTDKKWWQ